MRSEIHSVCVCCLGKDIVRILLEVCGENLLRAIHTYVISCDSGLFLALRSARFGTTTKY